MSRRRVISSRSTKPNTTELMNFLKDIQGHVNKMGTVTIPATFEMRDREGKWKPLEVLGEERMQAFVQDFMKNIYIPQVLHPAFWEGKASGGSESGAVNNQRYQPIIDRGSKWFKWDRGPKTEFKREPNLSGQWAQGFQKLFNNLTNVVVTEGGNRVGIGPRKLLESQKLLHYNMLRGATKPTRFGEFFYAAEFGTGIAENVGGEQWVNRQGPSKEDDGKWWFTDKRGRGGRFQGQRGLHFLFDARSRTPRPYYYDKMAELLPAALDNYFQKQLGGAIRRVR